MLKKNTKRVFVSLLTAGVVLGGIPVYQRQNQQRLLRPKKGKLRTSSYFHGCKCLIIQLHIVKRELNWL